VANESKLVYSTETGRIKYPKEYKDRQSSDGTVRVCFEKKGRKGSGVTTISGLQIPDEELKILAKNLKQLCGTGGTLKNYVIEIQGDHREKLRANLEQRGHIVL
jgi:translation initiation factor 1